MDGMMYCSIILVLLYDFICVGIDPMEAFIEKYVKLYLMYILSL